jgi:hypothetical protein
VAAPVAAHVVDSSSEPASWTCRRPTAIVDPHRRLVDVLPWPVAGTSSGGLVVNHGSTWRQPSDNLVSRSALPRRPVRMRSVETCKLIMCGRTSTHTPNKLIYIFGYLRIYTTTIDRNPIAALAAIRQRSSSTDPCQRHSSTSLRLAVAFAAGTSSSCTRDTKR